MLKDVLLNSTPYSVKRAVSRRLWVFGYPTSFLRVDPNFIIAGAQKGGTTSLHASLQSSPFVSMSRRKEVHYFDEHSARRKYWYRSHFPIRNPFNRYRVVGESTPSYLFTPGFAERVNLELPRVKIVLMLRNPVDRAVSHYLRQVRRGNEQRQLIAALFGSHERVVEIREKMLEGKGSAEEVSYYYSYSYLARGLYLEQIAPLMTVLGRERVHIINYDDYRLDYASCIKGLAKFLDVDLSMLHKPAVRNVASNTQSVSAEDTMRIEEFFHKPNYELKKKYGISFA